MISSLTFEVETKLINTLDISDNLKRNLKIKMKDVRTKILNDRELMKSIFPLFNYFNPFCGSHGSFLDLFIVGNIMKTNFSFHENLSAYRDLFVTQPEFDNNFKIELTRDGITYTAITPFKTVNINPTLDLLINKLSIQFKELSILLDRSFSCNNLFKFNNDEIVYDDFISNKERLFNYLNSKRSIPLNDEVEEIEKTEQNISWNQDVDGLFLLMETNSFASALNILKENKVTVEIQNLESPKNKINQKGFLVNSNGINLDLSRLKSISFGTIDTEFGPLYLYLVIVNGNNIGVNVHNELELFCRSFITNHPNQFEELVSRGVNTTQVVKFSLPTSLINSFFHEMAQGPLINRCLIYMQGFGFKYDVTGKLHLIKDILAETFKMSAVNTFLSLDISTNLKSVDKDYILTPIYNPKPPFKLSLFNNLASTNLSSLNGNIEKLFPDGKIEKASFVKKINIYNNVFIKTFTKIFNKKDGIFKHTFNIIKNLTGNKVSKKYILKFEKQMTDLVTSFKNRQINEDALRFEFRIPYISLFDGFNLLSDHLTNIPIFKIKKSIIADSFISTTNVFLENILTNLKKHNNISGKQILKTALIELFFKSFYLRGTNKSPIFKKSMGVLVKGSTFTSSLTAHNKINLDILIEQMLRAALLNKREHICKLLHGFFRYIPGHTTISRADLFRTLEADFGNIENHYNITFLTNLFIKKVRNEVIKNLMTRHGISLYEIAVMERVTPVNRTFDVIKKQLFKEKMPNPLRAFINLVYLIWDIDISMISRTLDRMAANGTLFILNPKLLYKPGYKKSLDAIRSKLSVHVLIKGSDKFFDVKEKLKILDILRSEKNFDLKRMPSFTNSLRFIRFCKGYLKYKDFKDTNSRIHNDVRFWFLGVVPKSDVAEQSKKCRKYIADSGSQDMIRQLASEFNEQNFNIETYLKAIASEGIVDLSLEYVRILECISQLYKDKTIIVKDEEFYLNLQNLVNIQPGIIPTTRPLITHRPPPITNYPVESNITVNEDISQIKKTMYEIKDSIARLTEKLQGEVNRREISTEFSENSEVVRALVESGLNFSLADTTIIPINQLLTEQEDRVYELLKGEFNTQPFLCVAAYNKIRFAAIKHEFDKDLGDILASLVTKGYLEEEMKNIKRGKRSVNVKEFKIKR